MVHTISTILFAGYMATIPITAIAGSKAEPVEAAKTIECQFDFMGAPFIHVSVSLTLDGKIGSSAHVNLNGAAKTVDLKLEASVGQEVFRLVLAPDSPGDTLYLLLNEKSGLVEEGSSSGTWKSKLINPKTPFLGEVSGECIWPSN